MDQTRLRQGKLNELFHKVIIKFDFTGVLILSELIETKLIKYNDEPGTLKIWLLLFLLIPVMMIAKLEKSELSIRLADKMDKMDRTWALFSDSITSIFIRNLRYMSGRRRFKNGKFRFMMRISCRFFYYLIILASAFLLTRDDLTHDWFLDWRDTNMEVNELTKHLMEYIILFLIMII